MFPLASRRSEDSLHLQLETLGERFHYQERKPLSRRLCFDEFADVIEQISMHIPWRGYGDDVAALGTLHVVDVAPCCLNGKG
jgi:hypothetical protein